jgi:NAD(P)-dependent dehydrogenase (short-subunit alcohol dehydrogenase family)
MVEAVRAVRPGASPAALRRADREAAHALARDGPGVLDREGMMGRLQDKVAIVTGAAMGMGEAIARLFAKEGAKLVVTDVAEEPLHAVVREINSGGGRAIGLRLDVADPEAWRKVLTATIEAFGAVDVLVNNAGIITSKSLEDCTLENWERVQGVNSTGVFLGMKTTIPEMRKRRKGSIVNVSSIAGLTGSIFGSSNDIAYCASKWAVRGMTKFAANAYAADGIRVNSLHPGPTKTPMFLSWDVPEAEREALLAKVIPLPPHAAQPVGQAYAALFLASDEADFVTGVELPCDGGFSSQ